MKNSSKMNEGKRPKRDMKEDYKEETTKKIAGFKGPKQSNSKKDTFRGK